MNSNHSLDHGGYAAQSVATGVEMLSTSNGFRVENEAREKERQTERVGTSLA